MTWREWTVASGSLLQGMTLGEGATQESLDQLSRELNFRLPDQYVDFMKATNGASGRIGRDGYLELWPVEERPAGERSNPCSTRSSTGRMN